MTATAVRRARRVLRQSQWDAALLGLSVAHGLLLVTVPSLPLVAIGMWWNANTVAHNFIHRPFFRHERLNRVYSLALSVILGFPQTVWRERHLAHHANRAPAVRLSRMLALEWLCVLGTWAFCLSQFPRAFLLIYLPGWLVGLGLCWLQGHYEHARGTTSHYGRIYNVLFFNDGYHVEHHRRPGVHWTRLPSGRGATAAFASAVAGHHVSRWPPVLRWLDALSLDGLERIVLRVPRLQPIVVGWHERAFGKLLPQAGPIRSVVIVGGGLFPRTAIALGRLLPDATLTIVDARQDHLDIARSYLDHRVLLRHAFYSAAHPLAVDLVVIPMAFIGCRRIVYAHPPARVTLVHDWIWHRRGRGAVVSWLLLKRINLIERSEAAESVSLSA